MVGHSVAENGVLSTSLKMMAMLLNLYPAEFEAVVKRIARGSAVVVTLSFT